jgi:stress-induced morphogen
MTSQTAERLRDRMRDKLLTALEPVYLDVIDESHNHEGHGGWREGGGTHFRVKVVSPAFAGKSRTRHAPHGQRGARRRTCRRRACAGDRGQGAVAPLTGPSSRRRRGSPFR